MGGPSGKGGGAQAGTTTGGKKVPSKFRNDARLEELYQAFDKGDRQMLMEVIMNRAENSKLHRKIKAKDAVWEELKEDVVYKVTSGTDVVVVKRFPFDEFPFHEICGNLVATRLISSAGPFFVRTLDVGQSTEDKGWLLLMEYLEADAEEIDLDEPVNLYGLFYQTAYALTHLHKAAKLQHFDLRYDNIMIRQLAQPKDLFNDGIQHAFVVKVGDFGQCEFDFGSSGERPENHDLPREEEYARKWGGFPREYTGYDMQYFAMTLRPVLDSLHGLPFYYIHSMLIDFMQPCAWTTAQDRPTEITSKMPLDILRFLKKEVAPSLA